MIIDKLKEPWEPDLMKCNPGHWQPVRQISSNPAKLDWSGAHVLFLDSFHQSYLGWKHDAVAAANSVNFRLLPVQVADIKVLYNRKKQTVY